MNKALRDQVMSLPAEEKIELAMDLWESLSESELPPPTDEQIAEVERRLAEHKKDPSSAIPYEQVMERLWSRFK